MLEYHRFMNLKIIYFSLDFQLHCLFIRDLLPAVTNLLNFIVFLYYLHLFHFEIDYFFGLKDLK
jgi:hypothetical protein